MYELGLGVAVMVVSVAVFLLTAAVATHFVFRPLVLEVIDRTRGGGRRVSPPAEERLRAVEVALLEVTEEMARVREAVDFDRRLAGGRDAAGEVTPGRSGGSSPAP